MSPFCFFAVCLLVFSFTTFLVLLLLEQDDQDDGPSVPRRTRLTEDAARGGRGEMCVSLLLFCSLLFGLLIYCCSCSPSPLAGQ